MFNEYIFRIIEIMLQVIVALIAWKALSVWKYEIRGQDMHMSAKDLLEYIQKLRFLIHTGNGSLLQIYLNDIFTDRKNFYRKQLRLIAGEKVYFDKNYMGLFEHINVRSDIFLCEEIRILIESLYPSAIRYIDKDKRNYTYIKLYGIDSIKINDSEDGIYTLCHSENITIEEYFKRWEKLIKELKNNL